MRKTTKRVIAAGLSVVMSLSIFFGNTMNDITVVHAKTTVFDNISKKYPSTMDEFRILEIVPDKDNSYYTFELQNLNDYREKGRNGNVTFTLSNQSEMGYFIAMQPQKSGIVQDIQGTKGALAVSRAAKYGNPMEKRTVTEWGWTHDTYDPDPTSDSYKASLYQMYTYGLIKPDGVDALGYASQSKVGEYPIYARMAIFSRYKLKNTGAYYNEMASDEAYAKGVYHQVPDNTGDYRVADGYTVSENGAIYSVKEIPDPSVSQNSVSNNNGEIPKIKVYEPVTDIDTSKLQLPTSKDGTVFYIEKTAENAGNLKFVRSEEPTEKTEYYGYTDLSLFYLKDLQWVHSNGDWFREYIFGDADKYRKTKIEYITKAMSEVSVEDVESSDLIYLSGQNKLLDPETGKDISPEVMEALYNRVAVRHKALVMDYLLYDEKLESNCSKLALLLWQNEQSALQTKASEEKIDCFDVDSHMLKSGYVETLLKNSSIKSMLQNGLKGVVHGSENMPGETNGNFVRGNVYVYNHHKADFESSKSMVDALDNFANGDFNSVYKTPITSAGFSEVMNYITVMNNNSLNGEMPTLVTPAVAIQYILVSDGSPITMMKNSLRVLEIEPVPAYRYNFKRGCTLYGEMESIEDDYRQYRELQKKYDDSIDTSNIGAEAKAKRTEILNNRKNFVKDYLSDYYNADLDDKENTMLQYIEFTSMTVSEFNGRNEDLLSSYDIIYIGDEIYRNIDGKAIYHVKNDITDFTDKTMNGNVYFGIGDVSDGYAYRNTINEIEYGAATGWSVDRGNMLSGYIDNQIYKKADYNNSKTYELRFMSRDITKNKLQKMKEFLEQDGLVIVDGDILGATGVNPTKKVTNVKDSGDHGRVDSSSNLYEFLQYGLGYRYNYDSRKYEQVTPATTTEKVTFANLVSASVIKDNHDQKELLNKYVSSDRLLLTMYKWPTEYAPKTDSNGILVDDQTVYLDYDSDNYLDGSRCLKYEFEINAALDTIVNNTDVYKATLYFDLNRDGKYSKTTEKVDACDIHESTIDGPVPPVVNNEYMLSLNTRYMLTRKLPDEYCGILKWKVEIESTTSAKTHVAKEGYTLVKNITGENKEVKILQIGPNGKNSTQNLNLEDQLSNASKSWYPYLTNIPGYNVNIRTLSVEDFEKDFKAKRDAYNTGKTPGDGEWLTPAQYATEVYFDTFVVNANRNVSGVNMIVFGFGDQIDAFSATDDGENAIQAVTAFIEEGNPVLMTHDFIDWTPYTAQSKYLRSFIGQDKYGVSQNIKVTNKADGSVANAVSDKTTTTLVNRYLYPNETGATGELHIDANYNSTEADDIVKMKRIESTKKEVLYAPNTERGTILSNKEGFSSFMVDWQNKNPDNDHYQTWTALSEVYTTRSSINHHIEQEIVQINDGQITRYPYTIPSSFVTTETHSQWYELDLTTDADNDGESDVVVWYTIGEGQQRAGRNLDGAQLYNDVLGASLDPAQGYYIYNDGNVTYTGAGHADMKDAPADEKKLFVNTLLAAFEVGKQAPQVGFYDTVSKQAKPITCIAVPYDKNVKEDASVISANSTEKYKFVDPNVNVPKKASDPAITEVQKTKAYVRFSDQNLVRGTKEFYAKFYLKVTDVSKIVVDDSDPENIKRSIVLDAYKTTDNPRGEYPVTELAAEGEKSAIFAVDISNFIDLYNVNQDTGEFTTARPRIDAKKSYTRDELDEVKDNDVTMDKGYKKLNSKDAYGIYLPMAHLNDNAYFSLIVEVQTDIIAESTAGVQVSSKSPKAYYPLTVTKTDLLKLF